jgi:hypothetical protein
MSFFDPTATSDTVLGVPSDKKFPFMTFSHNFFRPKNHQGTSCFFSNETMTKSLPYLPTKDAMSIKSCISLKPRHRSFSSRMTVVNVPATDFDSLTTTSNRLRFRNNFIQESAIKVVENNMAQVTPKFLDVDRKMRVFNYKKVAFAPRKNTVPNDVYDFAFACEDLNPLFDAEAIPYLPSCDTEKSTESPSSAIFRLVPRSSTQWLKLQR